MPIPYGGNGGYEVDVEVDDRQPKRRTQPPQQRPQPQQRRPVEADVDELPSSREFNTRTSTQRYDPQAPYNKRRQAPLVEKQRSRAQQQAQQPTQRATNRRPKNTAQARRAPNTSDDPTIRTIRHVEWSDDGRRRPRLHPLFWIGLGMLAVFLLRVWGVGAVCLYLNGAHDPQQYAVAAHMAIQDVVVGGKHKHHLQAFVDARGHLEALDVIDDDWHNAHIIEGPRLVGVPGGDLQQAWVEIDQVTQQGQASLVIKVLGPYADNTLLVPRRGYEATWTLAEDQQHGTIKPTSGDTSKGGAK